MFNIKETMGDLLLPGYALEEREELVAYPLYNQVAKSMAEVKVDSQLAKRIISFSRGLILSNSESSDFYGGNLLGVQVIRFHSSQRDEWFDDVLMVDEDLLNQRIKKAQHPKEGDVKDTWQVVTDGFNVSIAYLIHLLYTNTSIPLKLKKEAMVAAIVLLQFRFITSIYSRYFPHPVDTGTAEMVYSQLSLKFHIKQSGSWGKLLENRADYFTSKECIHLKFMQRADTTKGLMEYLSDIQTRTRKTIKDQYRVLVEVREGKQRIKSTSTSIEIDGDKMLRDRVSVYNSALAYLLEVSNSTSNFYRHDYVSIIEQMMPGISIQAFEDSLRVIGDLPQGKKRKEMEGYMEQTLLHAFDIIAKERIRSNDLIAILTRFRGIYTAPKASNATILTLRVELERFVKLNSHLRSDSALATVRTAIMLYFLLRGLSHQA